MKKEANTKLTLIKRFREAKYKGQVIKLRYDITIKENFIFSLLEATNFQKTNSLKR